MTDSSFTPNEIEEWFWVFVERAQRDRNRLKAILEQFGQDDLIRFEDDFAEAAAQLTDSPFLDYMGDDASEDTAQDVADWVVSQGKAYYVEVWNHPKRIPKRVAPQCPTTFSSVAANVCSERFGCSLAHLRMEMRRQRR